MRFNNRHEWPFGSDRWVGRDMKRISQVADIVSLAWPFGDLSKYSEQANAGLFSHFFISKCQICTLFTSLACAPIVYSVLRSLDLNESDEYSFKLGPLFVMTWLGTCSACLSVKWKMEERLTYVVQLVLLQETDTWPIDFSREMFPRVSPVIETSETECPRPLWHATCNKNLSRDDRQCPPFHDVEDHNRRLMLRHRRSDWLTGRSERNISLK
jgi:hypothetical protein